jgi:hypothetical protein
LALSLRDEINVEGVHPVVQRLGHDSRDTSNELAFLRANSVEVASGEAARESAVQPAPSFLVSHLCKRSDQAR